MSKHTPGPWGCMTLDNGECVITCGGDFLATVHEPTHGDQQANAFLMAGAPWLELVLKEARAFIADQGDEKTPEELAMIQLIDAALAQARQ